MVQNKLLVFCVLLTPNLLSTTRTLRHRYLFDVELYFLIKLRNPSRKELKNVGF